MRSRWSLVDILGECKRGLVECQGEKEGDAQDAMRERILKAGGSEQPPCTRIERADSRFGEESR